MTDPADADLRRFTRQLFAHETGEAALLPDPPTSANLPLNDLIPDPAAGDRSAARALFSDPDHDTNQGA